MKPNFSRKIRNFSSIRYPTDTWINIRLTDIFKYPGNPLSWISIRIGNSIQDLSVTQILREIDFGSTTANFS